nr:uncharacterized protein LOC109158994 [Ipomoea batatas]
MRVNRTYPTIVGWSAELARKRVREENKAGSFGRGTVLPRISKPADIAAATSGQNDQPPVAALNIPSSSVDKVAGILQKLASTVGEFGEAMAEIGKQGAPVNVMRKTFSGLSNMLNVASTIEATATPTSSQLDDIFFGLVSTKIADDGGWCGVSPNILVALPIAFVRAVGSHRSPLGMGRGLHIQSFSEEMTSRNSSTGHPDMMVIASPCVNFDRSTVQGDESGIELPNHCWVGVLNFARKRVREENKAGSFGRGRVPYSHQNLLIFASATSGQNDQPPVAALEYSLISVR